MELLTDVLMELVPDMVTEFFSETCFRFIRERVENRVLQKVLCAGAVLAMVALSVLLVFGVVCLLGLWFQ